MSYIHNTILRGLNSIYLQAPLVNSPHDIRDLLFFCGAWVKMAKHHHEIEESGFFPAIEKFTQKPGLMEGKIQQIHEFLPGMHRFLEYVQSTSPEEHRWESFEDIVDSFAPVLVKHLKDTIDTLLALVEYDSDGLMKMYRGFEKIAANSSHPNLYVSFPKVYGSIRAQLSTDEIMPCVLGCADKTYEGGNTFPPAPFFVPYVIKYWFAAKNKGKGDQWEMKAISKIPRHHLEEKSVFGAMVEAFQIIAPIVVIGPTMIKNPMPIVGAIVKAATGQNLGFMTEHVQLRRKSQDLLQDRHNAHDISELLEKVKS
ncbi:hypothetical protein MMC19_002456 [Ptychographa xylographoides]|nr:hypothetical protein [Ptychographa xylographoides]